jgi:hypothetical protein
MIVEDDFVELTVGAASAQLEWLIRITLAAAIVITGLYFALRSGHNDMVPR